MNLGEIVFPMSLKWFVMVYSGVMLLALIAVWFVGSSWFFGFLLGQFITVLVSLWVNQAIYAEWLYLKEKERYSIRNAFNVTDFK